MSLYGRKQTDGPSAKRNDENDHVNPMEDSVEGCTKPLLEDNAVEQHLQESEIEENNVNITPEKEDKLDLEYCFKIHVIHETQPSSQIILDDRLEECMKWFRSYSNEVQKWEDNSWKDVNPEEFEEKDIFKDVSEVSSLMQGDHTEECKEEIKDSCVITIEEEDKKVELEVLDEQEEDDYLRGWLQEFQPEIHEVYGSSEKSTLNTSIYDDNLLDDTNKLEGSIENWLKESTEQRSRINSCIVECKSLDEQLEECMHWFRSYSVAMDARNDDSDAGDDKGDDVDFGNRRSTGSLSKNQDVDNPKKCDDSLNPGQYPENELSSVDKTEGTVKNQREHHFDECEIKSVITPEALDNEVKEFMNWFPSKSYESQKDKNNGDENMPEKWLDEISSKDDDVRLQSLIEEQREFFGLQNSEKDSFEKGNGECVVAQIVTNTTDEDEDEIGMNDTCSDLNIEYMKDCSQQKSAIEDSNAVGIGEDLIAQNDDNHLGYSEGFPDNDLYEGDLEPPHEIFVSKCRQEKNEIKDDDDLNDKSNGDHIETERTPGIENMVMGDIFEKDDKGKSKFPDPVDVLLEDYTDDVIFIDKNHGDEWEPITVQETPTAGMSHDPFEGYTGWFRSFTSNLLDDYGTDTSDDIRNEKDSIEDISLTLNLEDENLEDWTSKETDSKHKIPRENMEDSIEPDSLAVEDSDEYSSDNSEYFEEDIIVSDNIKNALESVVDTSSALSQVDETLDDCTSRESRTKHNIPQQYMKDVIEPDSLAVEDSDEYSSDNSAYFEEDVMVSDDDSIGIDGREGDYQEVPEFQNETASIGSENRIEQYMDRFRSTSIDLNDEECHAKNIDFRKDSDDLDDVNCHEIEVSLKNDVHDEQLREKNKGCPQIYVTENSDESGEDEDDLSKADNVAFTSFNIEDGPDNEDHSLHQSDSKPLYRYRNNEDELDVSESDKDFNDREDNQLNPCFRLPLPNDYQSDDSMEAPEEECTPINQRIHDLADEKDNDRGLTVQFGQISKGEDLSDETSDNMLKESMDWFRSNSYDLEDNGDESAENEIPVVCQDGQDITDSAEQDASISYQLSDDLQKDRNDQYRSYNQDKDADDSESEGSAFVDVDIPLAASDSSHTIEDDNEDFTSHCDVLDEDEVDSLYRYANGVDAFETTDSEQSACDQYDAMSEGSSSEEQFHDDRMINDNARETDDEYIPQRIELNEENDYDSEQNDQMGPPADSNIFDSDESLIDQDEYSQESFSSEEESEHQRSDSNMWDSTGENEQDGEESDQLKQIGIEETPISDALDVYLEEGMDWFRSKIDEHKGEVDKPVREVAPVVITNGHSRKDFSQKDFISAGSDRNKNDEVGSDENSEDDTDSFWDLLEEHEKKYPCGRDHDVRDTVSDECVGFTYDDNQHNSSFFLPFLDENQYDNNSEDSDEKNTSLYEQVRRWSRHNVYSEQDEKIKLTEIEKDTTDETCDDLFEECMDWFHTYCDDHSGEGELGVNEIIPTVRVTEDITDCIKDIPRFNDSQNEEKNEHTLIENYQILSCEGSGNEKGDFSQDIFDPFVSIGNRIQAVNGIDERNEEASATCWGIHSEDIKHSLHQHSNDLDESILSSNDESASDKDEDNDLSSLLRALFDEDHYNENSKESNDKHISLPEHESERTGENDRAPNQNNLDDQTMIEMVLTSDASDDHLEECMDWFRSISNEYSDNEDKFAENKPLDTIQEGYDMTDYIVNQLVNNMLKKGYNEYQRESRRCTSSEVFDEYKIDLSHEEDPYPKLKSRNMDDGIDERKNDGPPSFWNSFDEQKRAPLSYQLINDIDDADIFDSYTGSMNQDECTRGGSSLAKEAAPEATVQTVLHKEGIDSTEENDYDSEKSDQLEQIGIEDTNISDDSDVHLEECMNWFHSKSIDLPIDAEKPSETSCIPADLPNNLLQGARTQYPLIDCYPRSVYEESDNEENDFTPNDSVFSASDNNNNEDNETSDDHFEECMNWFRSNSNELYDMEKDQDRVNEKDSESRLFFSEESEKIASYQCIDVKNDSDITGIDKSTCNQSDDKLQCPCPDLPLHDDNKYDDSSKEEFKAIHQHDGKTAAENNENSEEDDDLKHVGQASTHSKDDYLEEYMDWFRCNSNELLDDGENARENVLLVISKDSHSTSTSIQNDISSIMDSPIHQPQEINNQYPPKDNQLSTTFDESDNEEVDFVKIGIIGSRVGHSDSDPGFQEKVQRESLPLQNNVRELYDISDSDESVCTLDSDNQPPSYYQEVLLNKSQYEDISSESDDEYFGKEEMPVEEKKDEIIFNDISKSKQSGKFENREGPSVDLLEECMDWFRSNSNDEQDGTSKLAISEVLTQEDISSQRNFDVKVDMRNVCQMEGNSNESDSSSIVATEKCKESIVPVTSEVCVEQGLLENCKPHFELADSYEKSIPLICQAEDSEVGNNKSLDFKLEECINWLRCNSTEVQDNKDWSHNCQGNMINDGVEMSVENVIEEPAEDDERQTDVIIENKQHDNQLPENSSENNNDVIPEEFNGDEDIEMTDCPYGDIDLRLKRCINLIRSISCGLNDENEPRCDCNINVEKYQQAIYEKDDIVPEDKPLMNTMTDFEVCASICEPISKNVTPFSNTVAPRKSSNDSCNKDCDLCNNQKVSPGADQDINRIICSDRSTIVNLPNDQFNVQQETGLEPNILQMPGQDATSIQKKQLDYPDDSTKLHLLEDNHLALELKDSIADIIRKHSHTDDNLDEWTAFFTSPNISPLENLNEAENKTGNMMSNNLVKSDPQLDNLHECNLNDRLQEPDCENYSETGDKTNNSNERIVLLENQCKFVRSDGLEEVGCEKPRIEDQMELINQDILENSLQCKPSKQYELVIPDDAELDPTKTQSNDSLDEWVDGLIQPDAFLDDLEEKGCTEEGKDDEDSFMDCEEYLQLDSSQIKSMKRNDLSDISVDIQEENCAPDNSLIDNVRTRSRNQDVVLRDRIEEDISENDATEHQGNEYQANVFFELNKDSAVEIMVRSRKPEMNEIKRISDETVFTGIADVTDVVEIISVADIDCESIDFEITRLPNPTVDTTNVENTDDVNEESDEYHDSKISIEPDVSAMSFEEAKSYFEKKCKEIEKDLGEESLQPSKIPRRLKSRDDFRYKSNKLQHSFNVRIIEDLREACTLVEQRFAHRPSKIIESLIDILAKRNKVIRRADSSPNEGKLEESLSDKEIEVLPRRIKRRSSMKSLSERRVEKNQENEVMSSFQTIRSYFGRLFGGIEEVDYSEDRAKKKVRFETMDPNDLTFKSHQMQCAFNAKLIQDLQEIYSLIENRSLRRSSKLIKQIISDLEKRNQTIRLIDRSTLDWDTESGDWIKLIKEIFGDKDN